MDENGQVPTSEIAWMFQSERVSDRMLAEALAELYLHPLTAFCQLVAAAPDFEPVRFPKEKLTAIESAFRRAVIDRQKYWGDVSPLGWLAQKLLEVLYPAPRKKGLKRRKPRFPPEKFPAAVLYLRYSAGMPPEEIARVFGWTGSEGDAALRSAAASLEEMQKRVGVHQVVRRMTVEYAQSGEIESMHFEISELGASRQEIIRAAVKTAGTERENARRKFSLREAALVLALVAAVSFFAWSSRLLVPEEGSLPPPPTPTARRERRITLDERQGMFWYSYIVQAGDTALSVARRAGLDVEEVIKSNNLRDSGMLTSGQTLKLPSNQGFVRRLNPTQVAPVSQPTPLTGGSTVGQVRTRISNDREYWNTLWASQVVVDYGAAGFIGPPRWLTHGLTWISQPDLHLVIDRDWTGENWNALYQVGQMSFHRNSFSPGISGSFGISDPYLMALGRNFLADGYDFKVAGSAIVAGRDAVILDFQAHQPRIPVRFFIDALTGFPLRWQVFSYSSPRQVLYEMVTLDIRYDIDIPPEIFDPSADWFTGGNVDYRGEETPLEYSGTPEWLTLRSLPDAKVPPPDGIDYRDLPLAIAWDGEWDRFINLQAGAESDLREAEIYLGDYFMGEADLSNNQVYGCTRSPDGRLVVLSGNFFESETVRSNVVWFDLQHPEIIHDLDDSLVMGSYAIDPTGARIVSTGCPQSMTCGLVVTDLRTKKYEVIVPMLQRFNVTEIGWSADGETIAYRGFTFGNEDTACVTYVVRASDGEILFTGAPGDCASGGEDLQEFGIDMQAIIRRDCRYP